MADNAPDSGDDPAVWAQALFLGLRHWVANGGCQGPSGAFHAWRDEATGHLAFEYPEITGYALTHLCGHNDPDPTERRAAATAANWLLERLARRKNLSARDDWDGWAIYNFDLAMIATGLMIAAPVLDDVRCRDVGLDLVAFIADQIRDGKRVPAVVYAAEGSTRRGWSVDGEAHMLKALQCFVLAEQAGAPDRGDAIRTMAASAAELQEDDGRFRTQAIDDRTMLHPHLYAVEGLWAYGRAHSDEAALHSARRAAEWAWQHQLPTGGFPRFVPVDGAVDVDSPEQFDVTAQALRAAYLFDLDEQGRDLATLRLCQVARRTHDALALPYQSPPAPSHHNAWVGMFAAQASGLAAGAAEISWKTLI